MTQKYGCAFCDGDAVAKMITRVEVLDAEAIREAIGVDLGNREESYHACPTCLQRMLGLGARLEEDGSAALGPVPDADAPEREVDEDHQEGLD